MNDIAPVKQQRRDPCIEWHQCRDRRGYGRVWHNGKLHLAHRVAWAQTYGPIEDGLCVLHRCDNPSCINPEHLFLGTRADNNADMMRKGRGAIGDRNGSRTKPENLPRGDRNGARVKPENLRRKLTRDQVVAIRADIRSQPDIAKDYGIAQSAVSQIKLRKIWRHVP